jgi:putative inorganic carbon (HCO3(-)) transporter
MLLAGLTGILFYATIHWGGVVREDRNSYLLALGLVALVAGFWRTGTQGAKRLDPILRWLLPLLPAYVVLQIVPLPAGWVAILSPARAQVLAALVPVGIIAPYASLGVFPSGTLQHLLLISGYLAVFLLVRELMWFFSERRWLLSLPLVAIATWQAVVGMIQYWSADGVYARGNYANRNHFAGLLELTLPFAVAYPLASFRESDRRTGISARDALKISASWAIAAALLTGVIFSLSRMGFISALFSMLVIGMLVILTSERTRSIVTRVRRWAAIGLIAILISTTFLFLAPNQLVQRFARIVDEGEEVSSEGRFELWRETTRLIRAYPVFGCGLGGYESAFPEYEVSEPLLSVDYAHNDYLQLLAELGVVGASILLAAGAIIVRGAFRGVFSNFDPQVSSLALACAGSFSAIVLHSIADYNLYIPANAMVVSWIAAIATSLPERSYI